MKRLGIKLNRRYTRILCAVLNKSLKRQAPKLQLYSHLPPITQTIQVRRTRHAGHWSRSKDEFINIFLWTPTYEYTSRPAKTHIHQLCSNGGCRLVDLLRAMTDYIWKGLDLRAVYQAAYAVSSKRGKDLVHCLMLDCTQIVQEDITRQRIRRQRIKMR